MVASWLQSSGMENFFGTHLSTISSYRPECSSCMQAKMTEVEVCQFAKSARAADWVVLYSLFTALQDLYFLDIALCCNEAEDLQRCETFNCTMPSDTKK